MFSYLFRGATLVDGSGEPPRPADVAVAGNRIVAVGKGVDGPAEKVVDAGGLVLAPGFIDIHSHTDATLFAYPRVESKAFQGVTTEVTGNCGLGVFPVQSGRNEELADYLALHGFYLPPGGFPWGDFASYADHVDLLGPGIHVAPLVGHAPLRIAAMGMDNRPPTAAEMERMQNMLASALRQGAWGMSTGLIYPPGSYAAKEELVALARTLAAHGALYASHIRNEGDGMLAALDEAIAIGRESGARVEVSHLKAMGGSNRGRGREALARLSAAREAGVDVGADQYPYDASATSLSAVVPQWAHAGGVASLMRRLKGPDLRDRLQDEIGREMAAREGAGGIMVSNVRSERNRRWSGQTIDRIAAAWCCPPEEAVIRLLLEEEGAVGAIFFSMAEEDVTAILADPQVSVGSDGHGLNAAAAAGEATHPRSYGTFARVLGRYVRDKNTLSLAAAVHKMSGLPASRLGFIERGLVRPGYAADMVIFDPATVEDRADYADPHRYATGVVHLLVDGEPVIRDGALTGKRPGRVLRRRNSDH
ncbi:MAG TPA: D-aminoacylase [Geobacteraceae bacterium]|nr:D-aminoacylase [Geobacteraceae bacterium]